MKPENSGEYITAITKASPPISVTAMTLVGVSLQDWVIILTLVYTVLQIAFLLYGKYKEYLGGSK